MADLYTRLAREFFDLICACVALAVSLVMLAIVLSPMSNAAETPHARHYACVEKGTNRAFAFAFRQMDKKHVWLALQFKDVLGDGEKFRVEAGEPIVSENGTMVSDAEICANWGLVSGIVVPNTDENYGIQFCGATRGNGEIEILTELDNRYTSVLKADCQNADVD